MVHKQQKQQHKSVTPLFYRHPAVAAAYYALLLLGLLLLLRPAFAGAAAVALFSGAVRRLGLRAVLCQVRGFLPLFLFIVLLQVLTVQRGYTVLCYLPWGPLTAESLRFGWLTALLFYCLLLLFGAAQADLAAGRGAALLPAGLPATLAYASLVLRQVGVLKQDWQGILCAQRSVDAQFLRGPLRKRVADAAAALSLLFDLAMAGGMEAADLLSARGYGLKPRSSYRPFLWQAADKWLLALLGVGTLLLLLLLVQAGGWQAYAVNPPADFWDAAALLLWCALLFIPLLTGGEAA